jgi:hypothetical protein
MNVVNPLTKLFPDEPYRFHLRFERGRAADFFAPSPAHQAIVKERLHWLRTAPQMYAALLPEAGWLLDEVIELAHDWHGFSPGEGLVDVSERCIALGSFWEPDFLLLKADADGEIRLHGGCLCFPSSWRLGDKIGKPIEFIHAPVPGLNERIGPGIHKFLAGLKPGGAWLRHNWGLARDAELNHHPDRRSPPLDGNVRVDEVFVRVEHQALVALPKSGGILFGIRVVNHPLAEILVDPFARTGLRRALETMPEAVLAYKGIATARRRILTLLAG